VETEEIYLDIHRAVPYGLILNEALTNALQHAFPGAAEGRVDIILTAAQRGKIRLQVADTGVGFELSGESAETGSLGLQLIKVLIEQIGGTYELERRGGSRLTFLFPAE
jgi:two-component sensor histidine kinase